MQLKMGVPCVHNSWTPDNKGKSIVTFWYQPKNILKFQWPQRFGSDRDKSKRTGFIPISKPARFSVHEQKVRIQCLPNLNIFKPFILMIFCS